MCERIKQMQGRDIVVDDYVVYIVLWSSKGE